MSIVPRALTGPASTQKSKVQSLIQISSRSDMGETQGMTHPKANWTCEIEYVVSFQNTMMGQEEDNHPHWKKKKKERKKE